MSSGPFSSNSFYLIFKLPEGSLLSLNNFTNALTTVACRLGYSPSDLRFISTYNFHTGIVYIYFKLNSKPFFKQSLLIQVCNSIIYILKDKNILYRCSYCAPSRVPSRVRDLFSSSSICSSFNFSGLLGLFFDFNSLTRFCFLFTLFYGYFKRFLIWVSYSILWFICVKILNR